MAIPTEASLNPLAPHGLIARHSVFNKTCKQVSVVWQTIGEWRTIVKDVFIFAVCSGLMLRNGCFERFVTCPIRERLIFKRRKLWLRLYRWIRHGASVYGLGTLGAEISSRV